MAIVFYHLKLYVHKILKAELLNICMFMLNGFFDALCYSATGEVRIQATVPDTITSWVATAFAINENTGLGIVPRSASVSFVSVVYNCITKP